MFSNLVNSKKVLIAALKQLVLLYSSLCHLFRCLTRVNQVISSPGGMLVSVPRVGFMSGLSLHPASHLSPAFFLPLQLCLFWNFLSPVLHHLASSCPQWDNLLSRSADPVACPPSCSSFTQSQLKNQFFLHQLLLIIRPFRNICLMSTACSWPMWVAIKIPEELSS